jgi:hypothetical protein
VTALDLSVQFSDFDYDPASFAAPPRHHVFVSKRSRSITAECGDCHVGMESTGHDESSRSAVAAWVKRHEAQA